MNIWAITGGRRGNDVLTIGLAQALGCATPKVIHTELRAPWRWLAPWPIARYGAAGDQQIAPPYPNMVLASGRQAIPHALHIKKAAQNACFTVALQDPRIDPKHFDFIWTPAHDRANGPNVFKTLLSPHGLTQEDMAMAAKRARGRLLPPNQDLHGKVIAVLIGGPNAIYRFNDYEIARLAEMLGQLAQAGHYLLITLSRRTPSHFADFLHAALVGHNYVLTGTASDADDETLYPAMLGLAEHVIVTGDSVNMVGEACFTGKPVQVFHLAGGSAKFDRFHQSVRAADYVRDFDGTLQEWSSQRRNATPEIAEAVRAAYQAFQKARKA